MKCQSVKPCSLPICWKSIVHASKGDIVTYWCDHHKNQLRNPKAVWLSIVYAEAPELAYEI